MADIERIVRADDRMMGALAAAVTLDLPDWWIGAGFLRNKIWDTIEGVENLTTDVDLVYFDKSDKAREAELIHEQLLQKIASNYDWQVRNMARMHEQNGLEPYKSTADGIKYWPETATSVAVRQVNDELDFLYCYGTDDLLNLVARPTPLFRSGRLLDVYKERMANKKWQQRWPNITIRYD